MSNKSKEPIAFEDTLYEQDSAPSSKSAPTSSEASAPQEGEALPVTSSSVYQDPQEFARGGLGRILKAYDTRLGRSVALKELLHKHGNAEPRFLLEARITARLEHPSIIPIYEVGYWPSGDPYYAMRLLTGEPLHQNLQRRPHLIERLALLPQVIAVCQAIAFAHAKQIIHRDLKPHNVLLGEFGEAIVIDWGLAKELPAPGSTPEKSSSPAGVQEESEQASTTQDMGLTADGAIIGTPAYMPPEQARGEEVDARADVYALGAILYHLVTGQPPYAGLKTKSLVLLVQSQAPEPLASLQPETPAPLRSIIERAMARDPAQRYQSAKELADELVIFQSGGRVSAHVYSPLERLSRVFDRHKNLVMLSGLSLLIIFLVGLLSLLKIYQANQSEATARVEAEQARDKATRARSIAEEQRDQLQRNARALLIEQGRIELSVQRYQRALTLLNAAYQGSPAAQREHALRFLLSEALQQTETRVKTFAAHEKPVSAVGFSSDGALFFTASSDQKVIVWDALSSSQLKSFSGYAAAFLSDHELLLLTKETDGQRLSRQDLKTDAVSATWPVASDTSRLVLSPGGAYVATLTDARRLTLLRTSDGERIVPPSALDKELSALQMTKTHAFLLDAEGTFYAWELSTGAIQQRSLKLSSVMQAEISPDGGHVAAYSFEGVGLLWDAATQASIPIAFSEQISSLAFSPDSARLAIGLDKSVVIYEAGQARSIEAHTATVTSVVFSPDGQSLLSTSLDNTARRWDAQTGLLLQTFSGHAQPVLSAYFSPSQESVFTTSRDKTVSQWDITQAALSVVPSGQGGQLKTLQFSPDGSLLVLAGFDKKLSFIKATLQQVFQEKESHAATVLCQGYSPSGKALLTIDSKGVAILWDAATQERRYALSIKRPLALSFFAEEEFATVNEDGSISFWDTASGTEQRSIASPGKPLRASASARGGWFVLMMPQELRLFSLKQERFTKTIEAPSSNIVLAAVFSSAEERLLVLSFGSNADVFDLARERWVASLSLGPQGFISAVYSPDDTLLATTSADGVIALWDAQKNVLLASRRSSVYLDGAVMAFSPDGSLLASTTATSELIFWKISPEGRAAKVIDALTQRLSPWRFEEGNLVLQ